METIKISKDQILATSATATLIRDHWQWLRQLGRMGGRMGLLGLAHNKGFRASIRSTFPHTTALKIH